MTGIEQIAPFFHRSNLLEKRCTIHNASSSGPFPQGRFICNIPGVYFCVVESGIFFHWPGNFLFFQLLYTRVDEWVYCFAGSNLQRPLFLEDAAHFLACNETKQIKIAWSLRLKPKGEGIASEMRWHYGIDRQNAKDQPKMLTWWIGEVLHRDFVQKASSLPPMDLSIGNTTKKDYFRTENC